MKAISEKAAVLRTHNAFHLGDNLVHLHFLRKAAIANPRKAFVHAAGYAYQHELRPLAEDVPNLKLTELDSDPVYGWKDWNQSHIEFGNSVSVNSWRGINNFWYDNPDRADFVKFHVEHWFPYLANELSIENPIKSGADMLFDYPAIKTCGERLPIQFRNRFDLLLINSAPGSGQFKGYNEFLLAQLASKIASRGFRVICTAPLPELPAKANCICTQDHQLGVTDIGHLSMHCRVIAGVSTGPMWPTFNVWNSDKSGPRRIILLDNERVELSPNTTHVDNIADAAALLGAEDLL